MTGRPTLIILPGWGGSHETWADFVALAKPHFANVVVIDLPCFGDEPCPTEVWGVEEYVVFAKKRIHEVAQKPVILLGHSFGGGVASVIAATEPSLVSHLVLVGAAIYRPSKRFRRIFFGSIAKVGNVLLRLLPREGFRVFAKKILYRTANSPDYQNTSGMKRDIFKKIIREDMSHYLQRIKTPTTIIWGRGDTYVPLREGRRMTKALPQATLIIIESGKHGLHIQTPVELLSAIRTL